MKIGAEDKKKLLIMVILVAVAVPVLLYRTKGVLWGSEGGASAAPAIVASRTAPGAKGAAQDTDPNLRLDILEASRSIKYEPGSRNPFVNAPTPLPTPVATVRPTPEGPPTPTPTPPPPPIPLKFYGFASKASEPKRIFLAEGERIFVAGQNEIVDRRYKVIQIQPNSVLMEDMLNNNRQPIPLTPR